MYLITLLILARCDLLSAKIVRQSIISLRVVQVLMSKELLVKLIYQSAN